MDIDLGFNAYHPRLTGQETRYVVDTLIKIDGIRRPVLQSEIFSFMENLYRERYEELTAVKKASPKKSRLAFWKNITEPQMNLEGILSSDQVAVALDFLEQEGLIAVKSVPDSQDYAITITDDLFRIIAIENGNRFK